MSASCASAPAERRYAHMAGFAVAEPFTLGGTPVGYGFLLHGGIDASGALSDLWVYDLSVDETVSCPWTYIMDTAVPLWGGAAAWDPTSERFLVAGGVLDGVSSERASSTIRAFDPRSPASGLMSAGGLASQDGTVLQLGDSDCEGGVFWHEGINPASCAHTGVYDGADACVVPWTADGLDHDFDCTADPACEFGETQHYVSDAISPVAEAASWFDPSAGTLWLAGGTSGCRDGACGDMAGADLYVVDPAATFTLNAVNLPGLTATSADGASSLDDADLGWAAEVYSGEHDGTEATTVGLRGACAASFGWYWDRGTGDFDAGTGVEAVAFGGTFHQDLPAAARYDDASACAEDWSVCPDHCVRYEREWTTDPPTFVVKRICTSRGTLWAISRGWSPTSASFHDLGTWSFWLRIPTHAPTPARPRSACRPWASVWRLRAWCGWLDSARSRCTSSPTSGSGCVGPSGTRRSGCRRGCATS